MIDTTIKERKTRREVIVRETGTPMNSSFRSRQFFCDQKAHWRDLQRTCGSMTFLFSLVYLWVKVPYSTIIVKRCWYPMALWVFRVAVLGQLLADRFEPNKLLVVKMLLHSPTWATENLKFKWHQALHNPLPSYKSTAPPVPAQECHRPPQSHARLGWTAVGHDQPKIAGSMNGYKFTTRK